MPVNCAALPETILEAELFGYERGAFTGAVQRHDGRFLQADGGTLFLDEIGEIPTHVQVKLLRVLQEGEVERLGGRTTKVDLRLVSATNQDLQAGGQGGPLSRGSLLPLERHRLARSAAARAARRHPAAWPSTFLRLYCERNGRQLSGFSRPAAEALMRYEWPGNVRELENTIERAVVLSRGTTVEIEDLPVEVRTGTAGSNRRQERHLRHRYAARRDRATRDPLDPESRERRQAALRPTPGHRDPHHLPASGRGSRRRLRFSARRRPRLARAGSAHPIPLRSLCSLCALSLPNWQGIERWDGRK